MSKQDNTNLKSKKNCEMSKPFLGEFCHTSNLDCILNKLTCYKIPKKPLSIEMVLTYKKERFLKTRLLKLGSLTLIKWQLLFLNKLKKVKV